MEMFLSEASGGDLSIRDFQYAWLDAASIQSSNINKIPKSDFFE